MDWGKVGITFTLAEGVKSAMGGGLVTLNLYSPNSKQEVGPGCIDQGPPPPVTHFLQWGSSWVLPLNGSLSLPKQHNTLGTQCSNMEDTSHSTSKTPNQKDLFSHQAQSQGNTTNPSELEYCNLR